jgi:hypothetical protein
MYTCMYYMRLHYVLYLFLLQGCIYSRLDPLSDTDKHLVPQRCLSNKHGLDCAFESTSYSAFTKLTLLKDRHSLPMFDNSAMKTCGAYCKSNRGRV